VLNFAAASDDDFGSGGRQPGLSMRYAVGDTSKLGQFVIGLDDAVKSYRNQEQERLRQEPEPPGNDPWMEDLFQHSTPMRLPLRDGKKDNEPLWDGAPDGLQPISKEDVGFGQSSPGVLQRDSYFANSFLDSSPSTALAGTDIKAMAGLLTGLIMVPAVGSKSEREKRYPKLR
jgi:hypothetical protein